MNPDLDRKIKSAVRHFWKVRKSQSTKQKSSGKLDQGERGAVTGGAQLDGFIKLLKNLVIAEGFPQNSIIFRRRQTILPGYFRPTKEWDLLLVHKDNLIASIELKSHIGPSFSNNFNNRTEEAMGSATDLWTAYREGLFQDSIKPWLGYFIFLEDHDKSTSTVSVQEPNFKVAPEFKNTSYAQRYEIFCRRLIRERLYDAACLILSKSSTGSRGIYTEPGKDLNFESLAISLTSKIIAYMKMKDLK